MPNPKQNAERKPSSLLDTLEYDMLRAFQYAYYVRCISLIDDRSFDELSRQYEADTGITLPIGSDLPDKYTPAERALAAYLIFSTYVKTNREQIL